MMVGAQRSAPCVFQKELMYDGKKTTAHRI